MGDAFGETECAVVVGATGAMGQRIVRRLSARGLRVVAVARTKESLRPLAEQTPGLVACAADVASDDSMAAVHDAVGMNNKGPVRIVVHGPGVAVAGGILTAPTSALVDAVNIKVGGFVRMVRAVDEWLVRGSRLVAIGGHYGFEPTAYAATAGVCNAALSNLVKQFSWAYGPRGVTSHLVAPGPADTDRLRRVAEARAQREQRSADEVLEIMRGESAIGAFTTVEQIAWAIDLLVAPEADALAGSTLFMDAGRRRGIP